MEAQLVGKISRGSKMDQIYLSKNRVGFSAGNYVLIKLISDEQKSFPGDIKLFFRNVHKLPRIKVEVIKEVFKIVDANISNAENIIVMGSFLEEGYNFNDLDVIIISDVNKDSLLKLKEILEDQIGVKIHVVSLSSKELIEGISSDPIYENMMSKCVSKKRVVFNVKRKIIPQILDIHLLKSKALVDNFDMLNGREKYYLTKNMAAIFLFIKSKKISNLDIDKEIQRILGVSSDKIRDNILDKREFLKKYNAFYKITFNLILDKMKVKANGSK